MRAAVSMLCGCLVLGWAGQVSAGEGPPVPTEPAPVSIVPVPEPQQLPRYDAPLAVEAPAPAKPRADGEIAVLVATGSVLLGGGFIVTLMTALTWQNDSSLTFLLHPGLPPALIGVGIGSTTVGATLLVVGVVKHRRWKVSLETQHVQLRPTIGFGQIGVVGRF